MMVLTWGEDPTVSLLEIVLWERLVKLMTWG